MVLFERLVRFRDIHGKVYFGEAPSTEEDLIGKQVRVYAGDNPWDIQLTDQICQIAKVLCPLPRTPAIYGIGLNYKTHIKEAGFPVPPYPTIFMKPPGALNGHNEDVVVRQDQCLNLDYEGELVVIIGKDAKDVKSEEAQSYILGYSVGNDISSRWWQDPTRAGNQHGYAKSFDGFAPIGPVISSPGSFNPENGTLITRVNGEERQRGHLNDLLFDVGNIIEHLSRATTLAAGTIIMTGTPGGVAAFMDPPAWLKDGDVVEVSIDGIGILRNTFRLQ